MPGYGANKTLLTMVRSLIHMTDIWLFCSQSGQAASFNKVRWTRNWNTSTKTTLGRLSGC